MSEPIKMTFTRVELEQVAKDFMEKHYGKSSNASSEKADVWHGKYGMLVNFIQGMFPEIEDENPI